MKQMLFRTSAQWRQWLAANHARERGLWVVFAKKSSNVRSIDYATALDEALCYGWIDSIIKRIDDKRYARKFTPRRTNTAWSDINKKKVMQLIRQKRMTPSGLQAVRLARRSGHWQPRTQPTVSTRMSTAFRRALSQAPNASANFSSLPPTQKCRFIIWTNMAKTEATRDKRIAESIRLLERNQKLGLK